MKALYSRTMINFHSFFFSLSSVVTKKMLIKIQIYDLKDIYERDCLSTINSDGEIKIPLNLARIIIQRLEEK